VNDDDLTRALEAWADATDPAGDPVTTAEVTATDDGATGPGPLRIPGRRRWPAVAAAVVALAGITAAVAVALTRSDDRVPDVVTSGGEEEAPDEASTQVVVIADLDDGDAPQTHRFTIEPTCADRAACLPPDPLVAGPLRAGTSLVAHLPRPTGAWSFRYEVDGCGDVCGPLDPTGAMEQGGDHPLACVVELPAATTPRIVIRVTDPADDLATCTVDTSVAEPELTVPPAWSVRDPLPWSCGTAAWDGARLEGPRDREGSDAALACFADAVEAGTPVELPTSLGTIGQVDGLRESWWRVGTAGPDGRTIEVLSEQGGRGQPWSRMWCRDVKVGTPQALDETPPGGPPGTMGPLGWDMATLDDCTEEEPLGFDLPPLDEVPPTTTTAAAPAGPAPTAPVPDTTPAGPGTVDLVVDAGELPMWVEGVERRWVLSVSGGAVLGEGLVEEPGSPTEVGDGTADVSLVARGVPAPAGKTLLLTLEEYDCYSGGCAPPRSFPFAGDELQDVPPANTCAAEVPPVDQARVIVLTLRGETCAAELVGAVPRLTVPVAWTLRTPAEEWCADYPEDLEDFDLGDIQRTRAACVLDAVAAGVAVVEMPGFGDEGDATVRVEDGVVTLFSPPGLDGSGAWSIETCSGIAPSDDPPYLDLEGCTDQPTGL
jgi:hypothetical protein